MAKNKKITKKEKETLQDFRDKINACLLELGKIDLQENQLVNAKKQVIAFYENTTNEQNQLINDLQDKYGDGNINIDTGEFTPLSE